MAYTVSAKQRLFTVIISVLPAVLSVMELTGADGRRVGGILLKAITAFLSGIICWRGSEVPRAASGGMALTLLVSVIAVLLPRPYRWVGKLYMPMALLMLMYSVTALIREWGG